MTARLRLAGLAATALLGTSSGAAVPDDPRVRTETWAPGRVIALTGHYGYQMLIAFDPAERIETISIGDSVAWLVTPTRSATALFLKPVEPRAATNMTVQTTKRVYLFDLDAARVPRGAKASMTYRLGFRYPPEPVKAAPPPAPPPPPPVLNHAYALSGARRLWPSSVHDDGRRTYLRFAAGTPVPAILVRDGRDEALVDHAVRGDEVVIEAVAAELVLREGRARARLRNRAWAPPGVPAPPATPSGARPR